MKRELKITVNGDLYELYVDPGMLLVEVLRDRLGLTGTKRGCNSMSCGVCTVILDGKAVKSCTILALQANGKNVTTIEGMANGSKLHPIQQSFIDHWAFQCGFCTSGQIMAAKALLDENPNPTREEIKHTMNGHLCRCTGYNMIIEAILDAANRLQEEVK
ncbi:MAG: (2Fe-2S)-binding protein [Dehalococcoidia bacterium]|nr:(2Fe-2S)-binding protein [Dehalococcoidia bacterium]